MNKQDSVDLLHPSMLQIQYLMELEKVGKKRGSVTMIADICGVSHGPVSRFFKECMERGYLTEKYEFTAEGTHALLIYKKLLRDVKLYLKAMNIPEKEIPEKMRQLIENVDYDLLRNMIRNGRQTAEHAVEQDKSQEETQDSHYSRESNAYFIEKILEKGKFQVGIAVHQMSRNSETRISIEHLALIRNNTRGSWLELTIREIYGRSRIDGTEMSGHLSSLKYEKQGQLYEAVIKDGHLKIPLSACHFFRGRMGNVKGTVHITVACNIGNAHMPESTAVLTFWM